MLSPGDAALASRDREVPGLALVLDDEALASWLRDRLCLPTLRVTGRYVRYKPGTSCLVACDIEGGRAPVRLTAKALRLPGVDKINKARRFAGERTTLGPAVLVDEPLGVVATVFPWDPRLRALPPLITRSPRAVLQTCGVTLSTDDVELTVLSYKPERRAVLRVIAAGQCFVARVYADRRSAEPGPSAARVSGGPRLAQVVGRHRHLPLVLTEWLDGRDGRAVFVDPSHAVNVGRALAHLHAASVDAAWVCSVADEGRGLHESARALADLVPSLAGRVDHLARSLAERLGLPFEERPIHGDFAFRQAVLTPFGAAFTDLDNAAMGAPWADIGALLADTDVLVATGQVASRAAGAASEGFLKGYGSHDAYGVAVHHAARLLRMAVHPFRSRHREWPGVTTELIERIESLPWRVSLGARRRAPAGVAWAGERTGIDPSMPWLEAAADAALITPHVRLLPWAGAAADVTSVSIRRHKPGRRCLLEYHVVTSEGRPCVVLGKSRARGLDVRTVRLVQDLAGGAFGPDAGDGVSVPQFLGTIAPFRMWMQGLVTGDTAAARAAVGCQVLPRQLADAIDKVQRLGPPPVRAHTLADEIRVLDERLRQLAMRRPAMAHRLEGVRTGCAMLAGQLPGVPLVPAHRDFHPDQVLIDGDRVFLLDLDLYALAHPALDASNCIAHLLELAMRSARPGPIETVAESLAVHAASRLSKSARAALQPLVTLALARLIEIDDRLARRDTVEPLLDACERRLARVNRSRAATTAVVARS